MIQENTKVLKNVLEDQQKINPNVYVHYFSSLVVVVIDFANVSI